MSRSAFLKHPGGRERSHVASPFDVAPLAELDWRTPGCSDGQAVTRAFPNVQFLFFHLLQIIMIRTTSSCSRTSPTPTRYLIRRPASSAPYRSPWGSLAPHSTDTRSSCRSTAAPWQPRRWPRFLQPYPRKRGSMLLTPPVVGSCSRGTPRSTTTSRRRTCTTRLCSSLCPSPLLLLCSLSSRGILQPRWSSWQTSLLQLVTPKSRPHFRKRKTNTVSPVPFSGFRDGKGWEGIRTTGSGQLPPSPMAHQGTHRTLVSCAYSAASDQPASKTRRLRTRIFCYSV